MPDSFRRAAAGMTAERSINFGGPVTTVQNGRLEVNRLSYLNMGQRGCQPLKHTYVKKIINLVKVSIVQGAQLEFRSKPKSDIDNFNQQRKWDTLWGYKKLTASWGYK